MVKGGGSPYGGMKAMLSGWSMMRGEASPLAPPTSGSATPLCGERGPPQRPPSQGPEGPHRGFPWMRRKGKKAAFPLYGERDASLAHRSWACWTQGNNPLSTDCAIYGVQITRIKGDVVYRNLRKSVKSVDKEVPLLRHEGVHRLHELHGFWNQNFLLICGNQRNLWTC
jgi:hypothetical protein